MKLTILKEKLKEGLNIIEKIPTKSLSLPILNNILIISEKNFLNLITTDLEIAINWWGLCKIEKEGKIIIPLRVLNNFINFLPDKKINLEVVDNNLNIICENYKTKIKGFSSEEFPIIPKIIPEEEIWIEKKSFLEGLNQVINFTSFSINKPEISGIYLSFQKDLIIITSTDTFRLAEKKIFSGFSQLKKERSLIIPQKTAKEIINIINTYLLVNKEGKIKISFSSNQIIFELLMNEFEHPEVQIFSRLIEGEYPKYQEIIPKDFKTQLILLKDEFLNQIKLASVFTGKTNNIRLKINPKDQNLEIFSQNSEVGEYNSTLPCKIKGEPIEISFNCRFLFEGLSNIKTQEVIFELNKKDGVDKDEGPGILRPIGIEDYIYILMPVKTI